MIRAFRSRLLIAVIVFAVLIGSLVVAQGSGANPQTAQTSLSIYPRPHPKSRLHPTSP